ncbi:unnamed protein product [Laminaria digitata]
MMKVLLLSEGMNPTIGRRMTRFTTPPPRGQGAVRGGNIRGEPYSQRCTANAENNTPPLERLSG